MKPEAGKTYWVEFGYELQAAKCHATTNTGGIFFLCGGYMERLDKQIRADFVPEPKRPSLWKRFFSK